MTTIRPFRSYHDAIRACREAGGIIVKDSNYLSGPSGWSHSPTITFRFPAGDKADVLWNQDEGYIRRLSQESGELR